MKKNICLFAVLISLLMLWTGASFAADKIGFINLKQVMENSKAGKKAAEEIKVFVDKKKPAITATENELKKMKDELEKQGALMTPAARSDKELAYQRKLRDYQNLVDDTNKELQKRDQEYGTKMLSEIAKVVRAIGEKEKYTAIMDAMQALYYDKELDITNKVIEEYNKTIK
ncbi:MAG: OmpH family outer membrane protein [Smithella sp.]|jgi:outer membrane protein|nr:OmpH family outer membrane protein [Smithella sp.]